MKATFHFVSAFLMLARYDCSKRKSGIGGNDRRRRRGRMISLGIVDDLEPVEVAESSDCDRDNAGESCVCSDDDSGSTTVAGIFFDAAVDGLRSWLGEGCRLIEAVWIVDASSDTGLDAIFTEAF